jgi:hypothetical protein
MPSILAMICCAMLAGAFLAGCEPRPTYAEVQATARVSGCWPDGYPTPRAVTITPQGAPTAIGQIAVPGQPTSTLLPSTTALPRCPPAPGTTAVPWPTPVPPPAAFPTVEPRTWQHGSWHQTTLLLPTTVLVIDIAAHPSAGWPAVASVVWSGNEDPDRVFVSVYNPTVNSWGSARQVDLGAAQIGRYSRSVAIVITGPDEVVVVWGMSDPDFDDNDPPSGVWTASSMDFGLSWTPPQRIATGCRRVNDIAATPEGVLVVQLNCDAGPSAAVPAMLIRTADRQWQTLERLAVPIWKYSEGSLVITGQGADARAVGIVLAGSPNRPIAYLASRRLFDTGSWTIRSREISVPGVEIGTRMWNVRGLAYDRHLPDGQIEPALTFTWTGGDAPSGVFALTSRDGGRSWGAVEPVVYFGQSGAKALFAAPAYDPAADRLVVIWTCCADAGWVWVEATHYVRWSVPGSGLWQTPGGEDPDQLIPLTLGSRAAAHTAAAQTPGSRMAWLAWVETLQRVEVRSVDLNLLIPIGEYPTSIPPTPSSEGASS